jgi:hypothetical protein
MTHDIMDEDEYGKRILAPIKGSPALEPAIQVEERAKFMQLGEDLRDSAIQDRNITSHSQSSGTSVAKQGRLSISLFKVLVITLLVLVFVVVSSISVYAAQNSLPGEPLYPIKSFSEDMRLSLTFSTQTKLHLTLDFTNRRMGEIRSLIADGRSVPVQAANRYQHELEDALQLAAQLDDSQLKNALNQVRISAQNQGLTVEELKLQQPNQDSTAFLRLQERLQEQVQLSAIGEKDPQEFRQEIRERAHSRQGPKHSSTPDGNESTAEYNLETPMPSSTDSGLSTPSSEPGEGNHNGNPGNGNHGMNPTHTPKP